MSLVISARRRVDEEQLKRWTSEQKKVRQALAQKNKNRTEPDVQRAQGTRAPKSQRCCATTKEGNQCRVMTRKIGPECWIHTKHNDGLRVHKSAIAGAGDGLFAVNGFKKGEVIMEYMGEHVSSGSGAGGDPETKGIDFDAPGDTLAAYAVETNHICVRDEYDHQNNEREVVNAWESTAGVARYANDARSDEKNNAKFGEDKTLKGRMFMVATKEIAPGSEIFVDYGDDYWKDDEPVSEAEAEAEAEPEDITKYTIAQVLGSHFGRIVVKTNTNTALVWTPHRAEFRACCLSRVMLQPHEQCGLPISNAKAVTGSKGSDMFTNYGRFRSELAPCPSSTKDSWCFETPIADQTFDSLSAFKRNTTNAQRSDFARRLRAFANHKFNHLGYVSHNDPNIKNLCLYHGAIYLLDWGDALFTDDHQVAVDYAEALLAKLGC